MPTIPITTVEDDVLANAVAAILAKARIARNDARTGEVHSRIASYRHAQGLEDAAQTICPHTHHTIYCEACSRQM